MHLARAALGVCLLVLCLIAPGVVCAQLEAYAVTHPFTLPGSTTTRLQAMGGMITCIPDDGWANPAFAGLADDWTSVLRQSVTSFDSGFSLRVRQVSAGGPVWRHGGIQVTALKCDSEFEPPLPIAGVPTFDTNEWTVGFHYGHRVTDRLALGIGISPVFHNNVSVTQAILGPPLLQTRSSSSSGFRAGATYALSPRARLGGVYDTYDEDVDAAGAMVPGGALSFSADSEALMFGVSYQLCDDLLGAAEWFHMWTEIGPSSYGDAGWRFGLEKLLHDGLSLRAGCNDGSLGGGVGYATGDWSVRYAFLDDWNDDFVRPILGASETHQFEVTYRW